MFEEFTLYRGKIQKRRGGRYRLEIIIIEKTEDIVMNIIKMKRQIYANGVKRKKIEYGLRKTKKN